MTSTPEENTAFPREALNRALETGRVQWRRHAVERLLSRGFPRTEILTGLRNAEMIEEYPSDRPHPSALFLGFSGDRAFHSVVAFDGNMAYIITVYEPDEKHFQPDLRTRIRP